MSILSDPERFVHDRYSIWNFIELDVGIIAASLPALKPLFSSFLDAARGMTSGPSGTSRPGDRIHSQHTERDQSAKRQTRSEQHAPRQTGRSSLRVSSYATHNRDAWGVDRAKSSEDSILPLHDLNGATNTIVVTKEFRVT